MEIYSSCLFCWQLGGCADQIPTEADGGGIDYEFYLAENQTDILQKRLEQVGLISLNMALRKFSEYLGADLLFFKVYMTV